MLWASLFIPFIVSVLMNPYIKLPKAQIIFQRHDFLVEISQNKRVLHLGCTDAGLLAERFERGELLHQRLDNVAQDLWGFDIDQEGIEFLQSKGFEQCIVGDVSFIDQCEALQKTEFDLILVSEVVEHLQNPGLFFQAIQKLMKPNHTEIVVTVPNAFRIQTLLWMLRGIEFVHPDHNYWFSYLTISNLFLKNGFTIEKVLTYTFQKHHLIPNFVRKRFGTSETVQPARTNSAMVESKSNGSQHQERRLNVTSYLKGLPKRMLAAFLYSRSPFWADGIIVIAKVNKPSAI